MNTKSLDELTTAIQQAREDTGDTYAEAARRVSDLRDNENIDRTHVYKTLNGAASRYKPVARDLARIYLDVEVKIETPRYEVVSL